MAQAISTSSDSYGGLEVRPMTDLDRAASQVDPGQRSRYRQDLGAGGLLDAALLRQESDTLVVTFHGALDRERFQIPRFERARSTEPYGTSCLYWSDPSLWLDPKLKLAWFTGTAEVDLFAILADRSMTVASQIGATRVVFTGSSGGGFAALQTAALVPHSAALVFNPQTAIYSYLTSVQRRYLLNCRADVLEGRPMERFSFEEDWSERLGDRYSAVRRYESFRENKVIYYSNALDWHDEKHLVPFEEAVTRNGSAELTVHRYEQAGGHQPPSSEQFSLGLKQALNIADHGSL